MVERASNISGAIVSRMSQTEPSAKRARVRPGWFPPKGRPPAEIRSRRRVDTSDRCLATGHPDTPKVRCLDGHEGGGHPVGDVFGPRRPAEAEDPDARVPSRQGGGILSDPG